MKESFKQLPIFYFWFKCLATLKNNYWKVTGVQYFSFPNSWQSGLLHLYIKRLVDISLGLHVKFSIHTARHAGIHPCMYIDKQLCKYSAQPACKLLKLKSQDWLDESFNREKLKVIGIEQIWKMCSVSIWLNAAALRKVPACLTANLEGAPSKNEASEGLRWPGLPASWKQRNCIWKRT